ncbi:MAG: hypothetical protein NC097_00905 [Clostridium sp.]|nr:hypothetical protein [Prevotella sp.]MCM1428339.1 hypothetical protein [Clostridium sp.]MCM1474811.1 hypothetical protein [Muribaculaceae bacterium]
MKTEKIILLIMVGMTMTLVSCKDKDEPADPKCEMAFTYDVKVPASILTIADAYVSYEEDGERRVEMLPDGHFEHVTHYKYTGDEIDGKHTNLGEVKIFFRLKNPEYKFTENYCLMYDPTAYIRAKIEFFKVRDDGSTVTTLKNNWYRYEIDNETQNHQYSIAEQEYFFKSQDAKPYLTMKFTHDDDICRYIIDCEMGYQYGRLELIE